jgi:hypothetical protein
MTEPPRDPYQPYWPQHGQPAYGQATSQPQDYAWEEREPAVQPPQSRFTPSADYYPPTPPPAGPPPGPPGRHQSPQKPHRQRNILIGSGVILAVLAAIGFAMPHASKTATSTSASPSTAPSLPVPTAAAPSPPRPDCATQVKTWFNGSSASTLGSDIGTFGQATEALGTDLQTGADPSTDEITVQSDAATIQTDTQAVQADPAPTCVPGLRSDIQAAAGYYSTSAIDATNGLNQLSSGNTTVAAGDIQAGAAAISQGNTKIQAATSDMQAYSNGQG